MGVLQKSFRVATRGHSDVLDITPQVARIVAESGVQQGIVNVAGVGSTLGITTLEFEPGCVADLRRALDQIAPADGDYAHNARWVTGGIGSVHTQVYGEYEWCMRTSHSLGTKTAVLLWPQDNKWPPEIDFFENWGDPLYYCVWLHYGGPTHKIIRRVYYQYSAQWTVYLAVWRHNNLQVIENGGRVANITSPHVPNTPMRLDIETMAIQPKAVVGATVVKWVVEYVPLTE